MNRTNTKCSSFFTAIAAALILASGLAAGSCSSKKEYIYLNDMDPALYYQSMPRPAAVVQPDDRISISVTCKRPELSAPFNAGTAGVAINSDGSVAATGKGAEGYKVNADGDIKFPILGTLHVGGLTLRQVELLVRDRLIRDNYIKDPTVTADFLNFRYHVLGAVNSKGSFTVEGDRITLLEAIARAGDLSGDALFDRVIVVREEPDGRKAYVNDIRSKDIFNSPVFYLQQNDLVYVEPKKKPGSEKNEQRAWQFTTLAISIASVVTSIIWATR